MDRACRLTLEERIHLEDAAAAPLYFFDAAGASPVGDSRDLLPGRHASLHGVDEAFLASLPASIVRGPLAAESRDALEGVQKLREAYSLLAAEKGSEAGRLAAEAVRLLRDRCAKMTAPLRTPVDPSSRGFLIVWVLHANDAPPTTFLAGETAPATAEAINEGFLRGVQAIRGVAQNP